MSLLPQDIAHKQYAHEHLMIRSFLSSQNIATSQKLFACMDDIIALQVNLVWKSVRFGAEIKAWPTYEHSQYICCGVTHPCC